MDTDDSLKFVLEHEERNRARMTTKGKSVSFKRVIGDQDENHKLAVPNL